MANLSKTKNIIPSINLHLPEDRERYRRELTWNQKLGTSCGSIRGTARLCEISPTALHTLKRRITTAETGGNLELPELAKRLTAAGFGGGNLVQEWSTLGIPAGAQHIMLEYYAAKPSKRVAQMNLSYLSAGGLQLLNGLLLGQATQAEPEQLQLPPAETVTEAPVLAESTLAPMQNLRAVRDALSVLIDNGII